MEFAIIGGRYRGRLEDDNGFLHHVLSVIGGLVVLQTRASPLRTHMPLLGAEELEVVEEKAAELAEAREVIDGHPIGTHRDIRRGADGGICGVGSEPSSAHIDSKCRSRDFSKGQLSSKFGLVASCCWLCRTAGPCMVVEFVLEGHRSLRQQTYRHAANSLGLERCCHLWLPD